VDVERGQTGRLPYFATGTGPPLVFLGGLAPETEDDFDLAKLDPIKAPTPIAGGSEDWGRELLRFVAAAG
jgi:hypothetical protein